MKFSRLQQTNRTLLLGLVLRKEEEAVALVMSYVCGWTESRGGVMYGVRKHDDGTMQAVYVIMVGHSSARPEAETFMSYTSATS